MELGWWRIVTSRRKSSSRTLSEEERALWRSVARTASPLPKGKSFEVQTSQPVKQSIKMDAKYSDVLKPELEEHRRLPEPRLQPFINKSNPKTSLSKRPSYVQSLKSAAGLDRNTARRLKQGRLEPQARVDLHGMTTGRAHKVLTSFVLGAYNSGKRCVLVITGKGGRHRQQNEHHIRDFSEVGVLKTITPEWLAAPPISNVVVGVYPAHLKHGGAGALYVYLRKNEILRGRGE